MFSILRRHFSFAGLIATLALVFSMSGGAFAAHYIITSTKQIKPSVLKQLRGKAGPGGATGAQGAEGKQGPVGPKGATGSQGPKGDEGPTGPEGTFGSKPLPTGESLAGVWSVMIEPHITESISISYPIQVIPPPTEMNLVQATGFDFVFDPSNGEFIATLEPEEAEQHCPGSVANPAAANGNLCVYEGSENEAGIDGFGIFGNAELGTSPDPNSGAIFPVTNPGFVTEETYLVWGSWAVKAE